MSQASFQEIGQFRSVKDPHELLMESNTHLDKIVLEASRMIGKERTIGELLAGNADNGVEAALVALAQVGTTPSQMNEIFTSFPLAHCSYPPSFLQSSF